MHLHPPTLHDGRWRARPDWYTAGPPERRFLDDTHAVFARTDPPVDADYLRGTFVLDLVDRDRTLVINAPARLRDANEKLFGLRFPELCPDTVVTSDVAEIAAVTREWGKAVVKPTDGMAGRGIMLLHPGDPNLRSIAEVATGRGRHQVVVQRFVPESAEGDPAGDRARRGPARGGPAVATEGEFRCNMATGASVAADTVTPRDKEICARIADELAANGLTFVGI